MRKDFFDSIGQTEKNSAWANVFRCTAANEHCSMRSVCRKRAKGRLLRPPLCPVRARPSCSQPLGLGATGGLSAATAQEPLGCSQRLALCVAMWCDAQRRVVERCGASRRAALPTVMSISPTRLIDQSNMVGREAPSRQRCCRSCRLFDRAEKNCDCWNGK